MKPFLPLLCLFLVGCETTAPLSPEQTRYLPVLNGTSAAIRTTVYHIGIVPRGSLVVLHRDMRASYSPRLETESQRVLGYFLPHGFKAHPMIDATNAQHCLIYDYTTSTKRLSSDGPLFHVLTTKLELLDVARSRDFHSPLIMWESESETYCTRPISPGDMFLRSLPTISAQFPGVSGKAQLEIIPLQ
jgi:hypothetical protein